MYATMYILKSILSSYYPGADLRENGCLFAQMHRFGGCWLYSKALFSSYRRTLRKGPACPLPRKPPEPHLPGWAYKFIAEIQREDIASKLGMNNIAARDIRGGFKKGIQLLLGHAAEGYGNGACFVRHLFLFSISYF